MAKKLFAAMIGFALAPAFISAEHTVGNSIAGTVCLVRVYHTNFTFPPEGGRIVQIGDETFFWRTYLPECQNVLPTNQPVLVTSHAGAQSQSHNSGGLNGIYGDQFVGGPCAVRVYHTNFAFPPEGGKIVQFPNDEMYFVRTYRPGCENAGAAGTVLVSSRSGDNPLLVDSSPTYVNPIFSSAGQNSSVTHQQVQTYNTTPVVQTLPVNQVSNCY